MPIIAAASTNRYLHNPGVVISLDGTSYVPDAVGHFYATAEDAAADVNRVQVYDTQGNPRATLTSSHLGFFPRFLADIPVGYVAFGGGLVQEVVAGEAILAAAQRPQQQYDALAAQVALLTSLYGSGGGNTGGGTGGTGGTGTNVFTTTFLEVF